VSRGRGKIVIGKETAPTIGLGATALVRAPGRPAKAARRLRVALVTSSYNYIPDGVALTLNRLVGYLQSQGVDVMVFAPVARQAAFPHEGLIAPIPSLPLPGRSEYRLALGFPRASRERLKAFDPDIIHIAVPDFLGHGALALGQAMGRPVVASYHTRYDTYLKYYGLDFLKGALARRLHRFYAACREVYVPSASMAEVLLAEGAGANIHLWMRGVDIQRFHPAKRSMTWREAHGLAPGQVAVTFVGRLVREKQVALVAEVFQRLSAEGLPHRGVFIGDGPERAALERAAPGAVFAGFLGGEDLAAAYASSDVFFFPSDTETFGNVTLEAMASGLPTVCADATGSRSLVESGLTGHLVTPGDVEAFVAALRPLILDPGRRVAMGAAARRRASRFSWEETMAGLLGRYEALVSPTAP
jgi:phosphatidylinositol alpha 1,6-mannosyltransferase